MAAKGIQMNTFKELVRLHKDGTFPHRRKWMIWMPKWTVWARVRTDFCCNFAADYYR